MKQARVRGCWSVYSPSLPPIPGRAESHSLTRLYSVTHLSHIAPSCVQSLYVRAYRGVVRQPRRQPLTVCVKRQVRTSGPAFPLSNFDSWWFFCQSCLQTLKIDLFSRYLFFECQLVALAAGRVTQSLVHKEECIVLLKAMGSISVFQSGFKEVEAQC